MDKVRGWWLGWRLFLSLGKRKQGLDKAAVTMGIERAAQSWEMAEVKSLGLHRVEKLGMLPDGWAPIS